MSVATNKLMNLGDGQVLYNDLRDKYDPLIPTNTGTEGQVLRCDGAGGVEWDDNASAEEIASEVTSWLDDHVTQGETLVVDNSLSVSGAAADAKVAGDELNSLKSALNLVINQADVEKSTSGYVYVDFNFEVGKKYQFENLYNGTVVAATVNEKTSSATAIDSITGGATGLTSFCIEPTANASALRVYFSNANGKARITEIDTSNYNLNIIDKSYKKVSRFQRFDVMNSINSVYYPIIAGKSYRIKNTTTVVGEGNYGVQIYTRSTPKGSDVETVSSGLNPEEMIIFTATNTTKYIRLLTQGSNIITVTIDEVGTLLDSYGVDNSKKPYVSGQIHFTVPVNQKRLYTTQGTGTTAQDNETNIVDVNCVLMLPTTYTPSGKQTNLLMIVHGSGGGVTDTKWFRDDATVLAFFQKFLDAGFAIFDCNGYANGSTGQESWGVDTASIAYHKAYEYVTRNYNVTEQMCIYGFSMGGLNALNYCNMFPGGIKALGLGSPVVSLYNTVFVDQTVLAKGDVSTAYGFAVSGVYEAQTVGNCDPYVRIKTIDDVQCYLQRLPTVKIWHGDSDTAVSYTYSQTLANAINNSGGFVYYRLVEGKGHEICYGGNSAVANEIIMYFNRFVM